MERALARFQAADTQVLGVSIDSVYSHANWGRDLGGVSFPLLSDFEPKGAVAARFGHYLQEAGITDRATVIIDSTGTVRYTVSVTPGGERDIDALAKECEKLGATGAATPPDPVLPSGTKLFVKSHCGHSRKALLAVDNLHLREQIAIVNVSDDSAAASELTSVGGKNQAPCLLVEGKPLYEADSIVTTLADRVAPLRA